ncbi:MAG TPA: hypothetical protein VEI97_20075 [bacterium]|nr:hypothetical protein [bacterium]
MRRSPSRPTRFSATVDGRDAIIVAVPPDETDPETDYYWYTSVEGLDSCPTGRGFTDHQAVHDLIEKANASGVKIEGVLKIHEEGPPARG